MGDFGDEWAFTSSSLKPIAPAEDLNAARSASSFGDLAFMLNCFGKGNEHGGEHGEVAGSPIGATVPGQAVVAVVDLVSARSEK